MLIYWLIIVSFSPFKQSSSHALFEYYCLASHDVVIILTLAAAHTCFLARIHTVRIPLVSSAEAITNNSSLCNNIRTSVCGGAAVILSVIPRLNGFMHTCMDKRGSQPTTIFDEIKILIWNSADKKYVVEKDGGPKPNSNKFQLEFP